MNTESQTDQLKQRIAECILRPPLNGCDTRDLLRDCLKHIEELEKELRAILDWLRTINTPDVTEFLGPLTSLRMREIFDRLESLLGEKEGK